MNTHKRWIKFRTYFVDKFWLIPIFVIIVTFMSEFIEHYHGGELLNKNEFLIEVFIYSFIFPLILGLIAYYFRKVYKEHNKLTSDMNYLISFGSKLSTTKSWNELLAIIVEYLIKSIPIKRIYLGVFNPVGEELRIVSKWTAEIQLEDSQSPDFSKLLSTLVYDLKKPGSSYNKTYQLFLLDSPDKDFLRYGIPIQIDDVKIATIIIDVFINDPITPDQSKTISSIIPEVSLAIAYEYSKEYSTDHNKSKLNERRRIARVLHDTLAQDISYLSMKLEILREQDSLVGIMDVQRDLERMYTVSQRAYDQVRSNLNSLIPDVPKNISQAIQILAHEICDPVEIDINFNENGISQPLQTDTITKILNISREAFTNIVNHSGASIVNINIFWDKFQVVFEIEDNGNGIAADACVKDQHFGMIFMKERAEEISADLQILSKQNEGTKIHLSLPLLEKIEAA